MLQSMEGWTVTWNWPLHIWG